MNHYVYFMRRQDGCVKIGVSKNPDARMKEIQTGCNLKLEIIARIPFESRKQAFDLEKKFHRRYQRYRQHGEWFKGDMIREMTGRASKYAYSNPYLRMIMRNDAGKIIDFENLRWAKDNL